MLSKKIDSGQRINEDQDEEVSLLYFSFHLHPSYIRILPSVFFSSFPRAVVVMNAA